MMLSGNAQIQIFEQMTAVKKFQIPANEESTQTYNLLEKTFNKLDDAAFYAKAPAQKSIKDAQDLLGQALMQIDNLNELVPTKYEPRVQKLKNQLNVQLGALINAYQAESQKDSPEFDELQWKLFQTYPPIKKDLSLLRTDLINHTNKKLDEVTMLSTSLFERGLMIFILVLLVSGGLVFLALRRSIVSPLRETINFLEEISLGKLDVRLSSTGQDEIGRMRAALNRFTEQLEHKIQHLQGISEGNLTEHLQPASHDDQLGETINNMRESLKVSRSLLLGEIEDHKHSKRTLEETQAQLVQSEKMSSLGQLVAGVAHEINNPVNFLQSNFFAIQQSIQEIHDLLFELLPDDDEAADIRNAFNSEFDKIHRFKTNHEVGTRRLAEIVSSLKSFTRHDQAEVQKIEIAEVINDTLVILHNKIKKVDFSVDNQSKQHIYCHASQLGQVFLNLVNNAIYASELNDNPSPEVKVKVWDESDHLLLTVSDNGPGVPEEIAAKIFDPFFTTKPIGEGTGMGLAICYRIIESHKGEFTLEKQEQGACFQLKLPFNGLKEHF